MAQFYTRDGKVKTEQIPNVIKNMNPDYLGKILGITIKKAEG